MKRAEAAPAAARPAWRGGWLQAARRVDSPNFGPRPDGTAIELVVIHSISLPPGEYGGDAIERLFTNRLDPAAHPYFERLRGLRVSAHFLVRRDGELLQFVSCDKRAWHAGESAWHGRAGCNDFSIGIELEGLEGETFEAAQYERLGATLIAPGAGAIRSAPWPATSTSRRGASTTPARVSTGPACGAGSALPGAGLCTVKYVRVHTL